MITMRTLGSLALAVLAATLAACASSAPQPPTVAPQIAPTAEADQELPLYKFDGEWEGQLEGFHGPGLWRDRTWDLRMHMSIRGDAVRVLYWHEGAWHTAGGDFRIDRHKVSAVIHAMQSSSGREPGWVETWVFALTKKTADVLLVYWYRVINNFHLPADAPNGRAAFASTGEFVRIEGSAPAE